MFARLQSVGILAAMTILFLSIGAEAKYLLQEVTNAEGQSEIVRLKRLPLDSPNKTGVRYEGPEFIFEGGDLSRSHAKYRRQFRESVVEEGKFAEAIELLDVAHRIALRSKFRNLEMRAIVGRADQKNRIHLTLLGDGYTLSEREKFFADAVRITKGLFAGATFASYLPLFQVTAVFVPSAESGISDRESKNTVFGLHREPPGSKRSIIPENTDAIEEVLSLVPATDYPIIIANDDYYGGLGGRYAVTTRSERSGLVVLRHELGHNFGNVGEEYDGGSVYAGANYSRSSQVSWSAWLTRKQAFQARYLTGAYLWEPVTPRGIEIEFEGTTSDPSARIFLSTVGWASPEEVEVTLDGVPQKIVGEFTRDRSFFDVDLQQTLAPGHHRLVVRERVPGEHVLAFAQVYTYPKGYDSASGTVAAYATYNERRKIVGYRPMHSTCLMREMRSDHFCPVDQENMWNRFLERLSYFDGYEQKGNLVTVKTLSLQRLHISWEGTPAVQPRSRSKIKLTECADQVQCDITGFKTVIVRARFESPEVRSGRLLTRVDRLEIP